MLTCSGIGSLWLRARARAVLALALLCSTACLARAQIGFESLYKDINGIDFFYTCWNARGDLRGRGACLGSQNGYGVEISYEVTRLALPRSHREEDAAHWVVKSVTKHCGTSRCDTVDSTLEMVAAKVQESRYVLLEFGLGYSQFSGFRSADTTLELRGAVRETPSASMYATLYVNDGPAWIRWVRPYAGVRSGLLQLSNVSIYGHSKPDTLGSYNGSGTTFQLGGVAGLTFMPAGSDRVYLFAEGAYTYRTFPNVQWSSAPAQLPAKFPRTLDFTGYALSFGVSLSIRSAGG